ncbi:hypothetical protein P4B35_05625 [Pontiellaceae bacterium B12227]|nr:hypothetical protein [Pontiellaceae bacterium B12227]
MSNKNLVSLSGGCLNIEGHRIVYRASWGAQNDALNENGWGSLRIVDPLYFFGHGISYTPFEYSNLKISPAQSAASDKILITCDVTVAVNEPANIKLTSFLELENEIWVEVLLGDKHGVPCLDSIQFIHFSLVGDGCLIDNLVTSIGGSEVKVNNGRARIQCGCPW